MNFRRMVVLHILGSPTTNTDGIRVRRPRCPEVPKATRWEAMLGVRRQRIIGVTRRGVLTSIQTGAGLPARELILSAILTNSIHGRLFQLVVQPTVRDIISHGLAGAGAQAGWIPIVDAAEGRRRRVRWRAVRWAWTPASN